MTSLDLSPAARSYLLAFADDEHMVGSRHANWIGMGPFLEEDLAFCSIAQDELGHALALFGLFVPPEDIDRYALLRDRSDYRSCALAELECPTWDLALVRHWLYDLGEDLRWQALEGSSVGAVADLARQARNDERFHLAHSAMFMGRVGADPDARQRVESALAAILPEAPSLWSAPEAEGDAIAEGFVTRTSEDLATEWRSLVESQLDTFGLSANLDVLTSPSASTPRTERTPGFDEFHTSLGEVISLDTTAIW